ncbi:MBL fold metallo-hydrolase [Kineococcus sp. T13]|uniref:MBL fold metallo-hydrolase n=1 Tax=Kineococcus vitellinus TaxID=2696565 RepID=UPI00141334A9|nr:MBL fold metallo-hydrolase [Kineococcus vitellinus]NAZ76158.1 MBL fold metallo-hydrolase [Kineococcus vitellinus]
MTLEGTNTWLLSAPGAPTAVVVDPGEDEPAHRAAVSAALAGRTVALVVATHSHPDHVGGLDAFLAEHPAPLVRSGGGPGSADGAVHEVAGLRLRVLATPGHTADSLCALLGTGELLTGDTLLGRGSTVIAEGGDLGQHLTSLRRLLGLGAQVLLPGHGPARTDVGAALGAQLEHREQRLAQVRAAVDAGAGDLAAVVLAVHGPLQGRLARAAESSVRAHLRHLGVELP